MSTIYKKKTSNSMVNNGNSYPGLFIDEEFGFLAASPDGIIEAENTIVEIKCFPSLERKSQNIREASENRNFPIHLENDVLVMNKKHNYYYQVQGQLRITKMNKCYFICYKSVTQPLTVIELNRDEEFINAMMPKLVTFFITCVLPEIILRRVEKNAKCLDIEELPNSENCVFQHLIQIARKLYKWK